MFRFFCRCRVRYDIYERAWALPVRGKGLSRHSVFHSLTNLLSARYADDGRKSKGGRMPTEYYRKQAKALLKAARSGDPALTCSDSFAGAASDMIFTSAHGRS